MEAKELFHHFRPPLLPPPYQPVCCCDAGGGADGQYTHPYVQTDMHTQSAALATTVCHARGDNVIKVDVAKKKMFGYRRRHAITSCARTGTLNGCVCVCM